MAFSEEQHLEQMLRDKDERGEAGRQMFWDPETQSIRTSGDDHERTDELRFTGKDFAFATRMKGGHRDRHHG